MQLARVGLFVAFLFCGDAAPGLRELPRLHASRMALPALPARVTHETDLALAPLLRLPVSAELAIDRLLESAMSRGDVPGAVVFIGRKDRLLFERAYGFAELDPARVPMQKANVFDLASVTKAVATATSIALLVERGALHYDDRVSRFVPAFALPDKREITLRQLLTHTSGLPAVLPLPAFEKGYDAALAAIANARLVSVPGERYLYSDLGFIVLGSVVERAAKRPLASFARDELFRPLGLDATTFDPSPSLVKRAVPTERFEDSFLRGRVHDPRARALGHAGHAGLFSTARDLSRFLQMLANGGALDGVRVLGQSTVATMTRDQHVAGARVALGWDLPDEPALFSARSFGHEGFTGTSIWVDPESDLFVVFLSSRLHPHGRGKAGPLAQAIRGVAAGAVRQLNEAPDPGVGSGIDRLVAEDFARLRGLRLALLTHDAARARDGTRSADLLFSARGVKLVALLSPEHGLAGTENDRVADGVDVRTGLPVESLYGARTEPSERIWKSVDAIVVDLQDAGARFYTYSSTLLGVLRAAAKHDKRVIVLDRPNPAGGSVVEGPVSDPEPERRSFVDPFPLPVRHGMTLGELAALYRAELHIAVDLEVVKLWGWKRAQLWQDTALGWIPPSPNLRSPEAALLYPGIALFESTNLSVGRGTPTPFEVLGAPWLVPERLLQIHAPGVRLHGTSFVPDSGPFRGETCRGVRFEIADRGALRPVSLALQIARVLRDEFPAWDGEKLSVLLANSGVLRAFRARVSDDTLHAKIRSGLDEFLALRERHLAY